MLPDSPSDAAVEGWLKTLGMESLCQWDLLTFLHRHQTTLVGADHLAFLSGYAAERVVAALDTLESLGLVDRSRVSQGARLYQFTVPSEPRRGSAFERLLALAQHRAGRLVLSKQLRQSGPTDAGRAGNISGRRQHQGAYAPRSPRQKGRAPWRKAI